MKPRRRKIGTPLLEILKCVLTVSNLGIIRESESVFMLRVKDQPKEVGDHHCT